MQTFLPADLTQTGPGAAADEILRSCVHCGLCNATCPTYQLERNELDGPRGRIYLIKKMLEGEPVSGITRGHLDRCLTCQACETTCPSGVQYHRLLDIGRAEIERQVPRAPGARLQRWLLRRVMPYRGRFAALLRLGQLFRSVLPPLLKSHVPPLRNRLGPAAGKHPRKMILVQGCVQPGLSPSTSAAAGRVLDRLGIEAVTVKPETCCGALSHHLNAREEAREFARRNIDAWWPYIEGGVEAIVMTASGCSNFVQDYAGLLSADAAYAGRAARVTELLRDIAQVLVAEDLQSLQVRADTRISWHCPCTAQHGQKLDGPTREVLTRLGFELPPVRDAHLCCGSAGSYSLLQPEMAGELRQRKLEALLASEPEQIVTANIGCQMHLDAGTGTPVVHWIELVARSLEATIED